MQPLIDFFGIKDLIPHGFCLSWSPVLLWLNVISDLLITLAYYSIPLILVYFIRQRKDLPYPWLVALFAGFILACGTTHLLSVITIWIPLYWLDGLLKVFTAIISIAAAVMTLWVIPRVLSVPSAAQLQAEMQQRIAAEDALRESENKLANVLDSVEAFIYIKDCNYQYQYANQPVRQLFGETLEDIIGKSDNAFFDEATRAKLREDDRRVIELGERIVAEKIITDKNNIPHFYHSVKQPLRREDGSIYGLCSISTDITERKQLEEVREEALCRLQKIASRVPGVVYEYRLRPNGSSSFPFASEAIRDIYRVSPEEVREDASKLFAVLHPDDYKGIRASIKKSARDLTPWCYEYRVKFDDGTVRWLFGNAVPEREADGSTLWHGFITDISERKMMEEKLRESDDFNVSILNSLTSHIAVLDEGGVIVAVNNAWRRFAEENGLLGSSQDMLGFNYLDACKNAFNQPYGDEANTAHAGISAVLAGELETFHLEYSCHSFDQQRWFYMNVLPLQESRRGVVVNHENITERKRVERLLIQLKAMIDISLDGFWIVDLMGNLLQVNEAYAKISGYSIDELLNMQISQLEAIEGSEQVKAHIGKVAAQGHDLFETRHRHKDGHTIDIEVSVAFLPEFQHFCVFCRDITERKLMDDELKTSAAKFRSIIEASPVPMALNDEQSNITFLNPAFVQTFGYSLDDIPTLADWRPKAYPDPDYRHWVESSWQTTLEKAKQEQTDFPPLEVAIRCKNNSIKTVLVSAAAIQHNFAGEHLVILYDITQHKQIEAKLNAIFNASVEGIITIDMSGGVVSANAAVETIFGYKPEELVGCNISKLMPSSPRAMNESSSSGAVNLAAQIQEIEGIHKNGSVVPLDLSIAEFAIDNAHYFTNIVRDVSLRKHRELQDKAHLDELAHVTRLGLMGEMASGIAHEVNQPLAAVNSYTQVSLNLIKTEHPDLVKLAEILHKTQQQALRAGQIIHRMREFVKAHVKQRSTADINSLIHDAVSLSIAELKQNGVKLTFELENNLPPVYVDHVQVEQVIINLIRNSVDALQNLPAKQQGHLIIQSRLADNNCIQVRVKDNGPGIDQDQQQKILTPFFTTKTDGMGMGLSISRSLIEAHEGTLHFNSTLGKGTTFYFTLPVCTQSDES